MRQKIALRCECGNAKLGKREPCDPREAVEMWTNTCPICDSGGGWEETYFLDRYGERVDD